MINIYIILYFIVGILLALYWWKYDYEEEFKKSKEEGEAQDSMAVLMLLMFTVFWPIKGIKNFIEDIF